MSESIPSMLSMIIHSKTCTKCRKVKPIGEFHKNRAQKDGYAYQCKQCNNVRRIENINELKKRDRAAYAHTRFREYGLSFDDVKNMFVEQGGKCAICGFKFEQRKDFQIDHNHENGEVRQLLCSSCNKGLGCFKDDPQAILNALDYILKWNTKRDSTDLL